MTEYHTGRPSKVSYTAHLHQRGDGTSMYTRQEQGRVHLLYSTGRLYRTTVRGTYLPGWYTGVPSQEQAGAVFNGRINDSFDFNDSSDIPD